MAIQPGSILRGHYRIDALVGGGGMALVYRAFDLNLQRVCAIKQNLDSSPEAQQQFYVEAIVLANLSHPHLARVTDHFVDTTGQQYLVMDFVEGEDLEAHVRRTGPMAERQALAWISGVFDALSYCHAKGVIHRDIKPANLVKRRDEDTVVLVDFGIAKSQVGGMTLAGARAASPTYAPLEQFSGHTDPRSDVYALGATLYYLLTGREPPDARLVAAGVERITPPRAHNPAISPQTEQAVLQALALRVADRPQSVAGLRAALAVGQPPPPSAPRRPARITALVMAALALLAVLVLVLFVLVRQGGNGDVPATTTTVALTSPATSTPTPGGDLATPTPGAGSATGQASPVVLTGTAVLTVTSTATTSRTPARPPTSTPNATDNSTPTRPTGAPTAVTPTQPPDTGPAPSLVRPEDGSEQRGIVLLGWFPNRPLQTGQRYRVTLRTQLNQPQKELQLPPTTNETVLLRFDEYPDFFKDDNTEYFWSVVVINRSGAPASQPSREGRFVYRSAGVPSSTPDVPPTSTPTTRPPTPTPTVKPPTPTSTTEPPTPRPTVKPPTPTSTTEPPTSTPTKLPPPTSTPTTEPTSTPTKIPPTTEPTPRGFSPHQKTAAITAANGYSAEYPQRRQIGTLPTYSNSRNMETSL